MPLPAGGKAIYLPSDQTERMHGENALAEIDALVMTGGEDIDPSAALAKSQRKIRRL